MIKKILTGPSLATAVVLLVAGTLWISTSCTVTFDLNGGSHTGGGALEQTIRWFMGAEAPTAEKPGYVLAGWTESYALIWEDKNPAAIWKEEGETPEPPPGPTTPPPEPPKPPVVQTALNGAWIYEKYYETHEIGTFSPQYMEFGPEGVVGAYGEEGIWDWYMGYAPNDTTSMVGSYSVAEMSKEQKGFLGGYNTEGDTLNLYSNPYTRNVTYEFKYRIADNKLYLTGTGGGDVVVGNEYVMLPYNDGPLPPVPPEPPVVPPDPPSETPRTPWTEPPVKEPEKPPVPPKEEDDVPIIDPPEEEKYTVTFDIGAGAEWKGGGELVQTDIPKGGSAHEPVIRREGYRFNGWSGSFRNVTSDRTVTAQWKERKPAGYPVYTVNYLIDGGTHTGGGELTQSVAGGIRTIPPLVKRSGFAFKGWVIVDTALEEAIEGSAEALNDGKIIIGEEAGALQTAIKTVYDDPAELDSAIKNADVALFAVDRDLFAAAVWESVPAKIPTIPAPGELYGVSGDNPSGGQIFDAGIIGAFHALCAYDAQDLIEVEPGERVNLLSVKTTAPMLLSQLLIYDVLAEVYPENRMPRADFALLLQEVCGRDLDDSEDYIEGFGYITIEDDYVYWDSVPYNELSNSMTVSEDGNTVTIDVEVNTGAETTKWQVVGELQYESQFAPYELVSVTYVE
jgi:hypothetical protein